MNITIRPQTADDVPAMVEIHNAVLPDNTVTVEEHLFWEGRFPEADPHRWVAEEGGRVIACADHRKPTWVAGKDKYDINIRVLPERQGQGIGRRLYDTLMADLLPRDPVSVSGAAREDHTRMVGLLTSRGFEESMRVWESRLDVEAFDEAPFAGAIERVLKQGIRIATLRELESDPDRDRKLHALETEVAPDMPASEPIATMPFEQYVEVLLKNPNLLPDAWFVALDGDDYVGVSVLWNRKAHDDLETGLTGVKRSHRCRGIALALKLHAIRYAKAQGRKVIRTDNASDNRAMLSINEALGFQKLPAWVFYRKIFREAE